MSGRVAVALHDVEPATYERCVRMRAWLSERGIDRVTLLVIPAADLHPFQNRRPELLRWLHERLAAGDEVAQHGFEHRQGRRARPGRQAVARLQGGTASEFAGLDAAAARAAVEAGRQVMRSAGIEPHGFVAPAYAYTRVLREQLAESFDWWAGLVKVSAGGSGRSRLSPAVGLGTSSAMKRNLSPVTARAGALAAGSLLRLDLHPADLDIGRHRRTINALLRAADQRTAVTYRELVAA